MRAFWITVKVAFWLALLGGIAYLVFGSDGGVGADPKGPRKGSPSRPYGPSEYGNGGDWQVVRVNVDGDEITCIVWDGADRNGGISCDWWK